MRNNINNNEILEINHSAIATALQKIKNLLKKSKINILLISPYKEEYITVKNLFQDGTFHVSTRATWDLDYPPKNNYQFDLVVASNVFMYSKNPEKWFHNILPHTCFLLVQDLINRKRSIIPPYFGRDQDCMRYCYSTKKIKSNFKGAFDLKKIDPFILYFRSYKGGRNEFHKRPQKAPLHFCLIIKGKSDINPKEIPPKDYWRLKINLFWLIIKSSLKPIIKR